MAEQLVNVHDLVGRCPFATSQKLLAGKWSLLIMHELSEGPVRFRELERQIISNYASNTYKSVAPNGG